MVRPGQGDERGDDAFLDEADGFLRAGIDDQFYSGTTAGTVNEDRRDNETSEVALGYSAMTLLLAASLSPPTTAP